MKDSFIYLTVQATYSLIHRKKKIAMSVIRSFVFWLCFLIHSGWFSSPALAQEWIWQNPLPTGNEIGEVFFIDQNNGWAVGHFGGLFHTTDGGETWLSKALDITSTLYDIQFVDLLNGWIVGSSGVILHTSDGGNTWVRQESGGSNTLWHLSFVDKNTGWIVGFGSASNIIYTNDGGNTWIDRSSGTFGNINAVSFVDNQTGWVGASFGRMWHTTNGGQSWSSQQTNTSLSLTDIHFVDKLNGWAVSGASGRVFHTSDGGQNWELQETNTSQLKEVFGLDANRCWAVGNSGIIVRTVDAGQTWIKDKIDGVSGLRGVFFLNTNEGWISGFAGALLHTLDGGQTWEHQDRTVARVRLNAAAFPSASTGWVVGDSGAIAHTNDGGNSWQAQSSGISTELNDIIFIDGSTGWIAGDEGVILHTSDSGISWNQQPTNVTDDVNGIHFVSQQQGWAVTGTNFGSGSVLRTTDGGQNWMRIGFNTRFVDVYFISATEGWAVGSGGRIFHSTDGGVSWPLQSSPSTRDLLDVEFIDSKTGWVAARFDGVLHTTDGGGTWTQISSKIISQLKFLDKNNGWAVESGVVFRTNNGGIFWQEFRPVSASFNNLAFVSNEEGWLVGNSGVIVKFEGAFTNTPKIFVSKDTLSFGTLLFGSSKQLSLTIKNEGSADLHITTITIDNSDFLIDTSPVTIFPSQSFSRNVTFQPTFDGPISGMLTIISNDPATPNLDVVLQGEGRLSTIIHVDKNAPGKQNGKSWFDAYHSIQVAIDQAGTIDGLDQIWVAAGRYVENIIMRGSVEIYGGFAGNETSLDQRDFLANETIIDGGGSGSVITITGGKVDGFTITNGNSAFGGGINVDPGNPTIRNNKIIGNKASFGGGIDVTGLAVSALVERNLITGNSASAGGDAISASNSNAKIINNTIVNNTGNAGDGIDSPGFFSDPDIKNCILWGNGDELTGGATATYSIIEDGDAGTGNLAVDPLFVDPDNGDFRLRAGSPAIDAGDPASPSDPDGTRADIGAFYFDQGPPVMLTSTSPEQNTINVDPNVNIEITFGQAMQAATINSSTFKVRGSQTGPHVGAISYDNATNTARFDPAKAFADGEVVSVVLTNEIKAASGSVLRAFALNFIIRASHATTGSFSEPINYIVGMEPRAIAACDLDGDGDVDVVTANWTSDNVSVLLNKGNGEFLTPKNFTVGSNTDPRSVFCGDLDGDGDMDIAVGNYGSPSVSILSNIGGGNFLPPFILRTSSSFNVTIDGADFDNNGAVDLVVVQTFLINRVEVFLNAGNGIFSDGTTYTLGNNPTGIYSGDLDNDGDVDIAVANAGSNDISILLNSGNGIFSNQITYATGESPFFIHGGDLDNDGDIDLFTANNDSGRVSVLLNNGDATFAEAGKYDVGDTPWYIQSADLDGDGDLDLITSNHGSDDISVLFNDGNGSFPQSKSFAVQTNPRATVSADLDGDGDLDIVVANRVSNSVSVLLNEGAQLQPPQNLVATVNQQTVTLTWQAPAGGSGEAKLSGYNIYRSNEPNAKDTGALVGNVGTSTTSFDDSNVTGGTQYYYVVTAVYDEGESGPSNEASAMPAGLLPPPPTLASPPDGSTGISISPPFTWNSSSGAASYRLQVSSSSTFSTTVVDQSGITGTSHTVTGLADSTKYNWRVNASNSTGTSDWSSVWSFTTGEGTALNPPRNLTAQSGVPGKVPLSWDAPTSAGPDTIEIFYDDGVAENGITGNFSGAEFAVRFTPASYPVSLIGLGFLAAGNASNERYGIKVYLDPAAGNRGPTGTPAFTGALGFGSAGMIGAGFPNPITINSGDFYLALNFISGSTKDFAIGFDKTSDARRSWLSTGPGSFALSGNLGFPGNLIIRALVVTSGSSNLLAMADGPVRNLQVIEASGETPAQPFGYGEYTLLANSAPFFITSLFNASGQNGASNATLQGYNIYRSTASSVQVVPQNKIRHMGADTTTFEDTDVIGGTKYYYVATAVYSQGESGASNEDSAIPGLLAPVLASPDDGALNQPTTLAVRWNTSTGAKTYRLQLSAKADFSSAVFDDSTITATSQQVGPLNVATTYFWRVNASNSTSTSDWSSVWRFTTCAGDGTMLRLLPASADVIANGKVAVDVKIEKAKNLGAYDMTLRYDPALLQVEQAEDVKLGSFLESSGRTVVALGPEIDTTAGTIRFGVASYGSQDGATGDGILATIRFKAVASADTTAEIVFESVQIGDIDGNELTLADSIGNKIRVTIQCADVDSDCDVDVVDIQLVAGRWNTRIGDPLYDPRYDLDNQCSGDGDIDVVDIQICAGQWGWKCPSNSGAILSKVDGGVPVDISIALGPTHDDDTFELLIHGESAAKVSAFELALKLPEDWVVRNYSPGELLTGNGNSVVPLRRTDDDALFHIGAVTYSLNTTSAESGVLARLRIAGDPQRFTDLLVESGLFAGKNGEPMRLGSIDIGASEANTIPTELALYPNYPNPFNPATIIGFDLPAGVDGQTVVLNIYNLAGENIRVLVREPLAPGRHRFEWNGKDQQGRAVATGIYIARLHVGSLMKIRKMTLMK